MASLWGHFEEQIETQRRYVFRGQDSDEKNGLATIRHSWHCCILDIWNEAGVENWVSPLLNCKFVMLLRIRRTAS